MMNSYARTVDDKLYIRLGYSPVTAGFTAVVALTRLGAFTSASLEPGWELLATIPAEGQWFTGDENYVVIVRNWEVSGPGLGASVDHLVARHIDNVRIPLDAPFRVYGFTTGQYLPEPPFNTMFTPHSFYFESDKLAGEYAAVDRLVPVMPAGSETDTLSLVHITLRDAAWIKETGSDVLAGDYFKSFNISGSRPAQALVTRSVIKWADGTTEERERAGADTQMRRIGFGWSDAPTTPNKPVITGMSPRMVDPTAEWTVDLTYVEGLAGDQSKLVWRRVLAGVTTYWNQSTQEWQTGVVENTKTVPSQTFPPGAAPADSTFTLAVAAKGAVGGLSAYSDPVTVDTHQIPTATISLDPYVAGVTTSLSPAVVPGGTPASGQVLTGYVVEVLNSSSQRFAYATVTGMGPWTVDPPLPDSTTGWTVRLRVQQSGGALSDWASLPFNVAAVVPGAPGVTVAAVSHETSGMPVQRLAVDLPWETDGFDYETNPLTLDVDRRVYDTGTEWVRVGSVTPTPGWASGIVLDDEAPSHLPVLYRVRARSATQYGGELVGPWSVSVPAYPVDDGAWLSPVGFPELAVRVDLVTADEGRIVSGQSGAAVIGAPHQVVSGVAAVTGDGGYVARTDTPEDEAALTTLLMGGHLLTLSMTPERDSWNDTHAVPRRWFRVVGEIGVARVAQGPWTMRLVSWTATPQAVPAIIAGG